MRDIEIIQVETVAKYIVYPGVCEICDFGLTCDECEANSCPDDCDCDWCVFGDLRRIGDEHFGGN